MTETENLLITGGAGFIGSNFLRGIARDWDGKLLVLDALTYAGCFKNIEDMIDGDRVVFLQGDIRDGDWVSSIFSQYRIAQVVHLAAETLAQDKG